MWRIINFTKMKFYNNEDMSYSRLAEYTTSNELRYDTRRVTSKNRLQVIRSFYKRVLCVASWKNCDEILFYFFNALWDKEDVTSDEYVIFVSGFVVKSLFWYEVENRPLRSVSKAAVLFIIFVNGNYILGLLWLLITIKCKFIDVRKYMGINLPCCN